jgi:hypothetical protein
LLNCNRAMADQERGLSLQEQLDLAREAMEHYKARYLKANEVTAKPRRWLAVGLLKATRRQGAR